MIANIGNVFFSEDKLEKYKKISNFLLLIGLLLIFAFPYLGQETFIEEKHVKHSNALSKQISMKEFEEDQLEYFSLFQNKYVENKRNDLPFFTNQVFMQNEASDINKIFTKEFVSPRGDKKRFIMINLIFEIIGSKKEQSFKANYIIYSLMKFLSKQDRITWLAKDIQFNYIRKEYFFNEPIKLYDQLIRGKSNNKIINGQGLDAIINIDLTTFDLENISHLLIKQNGMNSENNDMDYYNIFTDNIKSSFSITTNSRILKTKARENIKKIIKNIGGAFANFLPKPTEKFHYLNSYVYFIENVLDNFLLINNTINFNHLLISKGYNSLLMQVLTEKGKLSTSKDFMYQGKKQGYDFLTAIQRAIKTISKNEIDLFRGQYHFVLVSPKIFVGYIFLAIPVLMIIRIFYEVLHTIYLIDFLFISNDSDSNSSERINASKVISLFLGGLVFTLLLFLHINDIAFYFDDIPPLKLYYFLLLISFISAIATYVIIIPNKRENQFIENILRFILALNCFNIIFINIGLGIFVTGVVLSLEMLLILLEKSQKHFLKIFLIGFVIYLVISLKELLVSMISNYMRFTNNVYGIISITLILFAYRIVLITFQTCFTKTKSIDLNSKVKSD